MKITYKDFGIFMKSEGYTESETKHLFSAVKSMDRESRAWVVEWFNKGVFPDKEIEGVTAEYLINQCGYKPLNAFIVLDWLKADPQAAKYFVLKFPSTIPPDDAIGSDIEKIMEEEGMKIEHIHLDDDLSDIKDE